MLTNVNNYWLMVFKLLLFVFDTDSTAVLEGNENESGGRPPTLPWLLGRDPCISTK